jgi:hypothetical protein
MMQLLDVPDTASVSIAHVHVPGAAVVIGPKVIVAALEITLGDADVGPLHPDVFVIGCRAYPSEVENSVSDTIVRSVCVGAAVSSAR